MHLFYLPQTNLSASYAASELYHELPAEEAAHLRVMRLKPGDGLRVTDGRGNFAEAQLEEISPKKCIIRLKSVETVQGRKFKNHLAVAPTKNIARYEWFIEKAIEIGVDIITPVYCDHSERARLRADRLQKVAIAAMKQSLKATLPEIREPVTLDELLAADFAPDNRFIAWIDDDVNLHLKDAMAPDRDTLVLIGPEGDFSTREVELARQKHFVPVSLGQSRLRTETAAVASCLIVNLMNEPKNLPQ